MKKLYGILTLVVMILTLSSNTVFAAVPAVNNGGMSEINPMQSISLNGLDKPTKVKNLADEGSYHFSGIDAQTLYSSYLFTGYDSYVVACTNNGAEAITVYVKKGTETLGQMKVKAKDKNLMSVNKVGTTTKIYLQISNSSNKYNLDFSGNIY